LVIGLGGGVIMGTPSIGPVTVEYCAQIQQVPSLVGFSISQYSESADLPIITA